MTTRRGLITGLISLVAAPAIVRAGSLMPIKAISPEIRWIWARPDIIDLVDLISNISPTDTPFLRRQYLPDGSFVFCS